MRGNLHRRHDYTPGPAMSSPARFPDSRFAPGPFKFSARPYGCQGARTAMANPNAASGGQFEEVGVFWLRRGLAQVD